MKRILAVALALTLLGVPAAYAQQRGGGRGQGQGPRMGAPAAQGAPAQRGPGMGQMRGPNMGHAVPRPPMHPAYRPHYGPGPRYGYGPRGYAPYGGAYYGYRPYPYAYGYGYPYYPQVGIAIGPGGWALGGVYGGVSVYYEKQTVVQEAPAVSVENVSPAFLMFEVDAIEAEVYVDGAYEGVVEHYTQRPLEISASEHRVELRLDGERVAEFKVRPTSGQTLKIRAKLIR